MIDNNTPFLNKLQFELDDMEELISNKKNPKDGKKKDKENVTRSDVYDVLDLYKSKGGKVSNVELASVSGGLSLGQIKQLRKELDYISVEYSDSF